MPSKELSRVGCKYMAAEKQGTRQSYSVSHALAGSDIVSPAWEHAAGKTVKQLRSLAKKADEEQTHLPIFLNMWKTLQAERPELFTTELIAECKELIHLAAQHEIVWGKYIISEGVMGLTDQIITEFVESLADKRLDAMDLAPMYGTKNPVPWFDEASSINGGETNFFEGKNASYTAGGSLEWDE